MNQASKFNRLLTMLTLTIMLLVTVPIGARYVTAMF
jgi:hypothetical protein